MNNWTKFAAVAAALSLTVIAQEQPAAPKSPATTPRAGSTNPVRQTTRPMQKFDRTLQDLTPEQRAKLDEVNKSFSATATPLYTRLVTARRELDSVVNQDKVDEGAVRAKTKEMADLETDIALARAQRYVKLRAFLGPEQARRFNQPTPLGRPFQPALHEGQAPPPIAPNK